MNAVIVSGDRHARWDQWVRIVDRAIGIRLSNEQLVVIHGGASGIDSIADVFGRGTVHAGVVKVPAQWKLYGHAAGPKRNAAMLEMLLILRRQGYDVEVLAFHDDLTGSKGTKGMVNMAVKDAVVVWHYSTTNEPVRVTEVLP